MRWEEYDDDEKEVERAQERIKNNPKDAFAYYKLGMVYEGIWESEAAYESCKKAIEIDPDGALFHIFCAYLLSRKDGCDIEAVDEIVKAIELLEEAKDIEIFNKRKWYTTEILKGGDWSDRSLFEKQLRLQAEFEYYFDFIRFRMDGKNFDAKVAALRQEGKMEVANKLHKWFVKRDIINIQFPESSKE